MIETGATSGDRDPNRVERVAREIVARVDMDDIARKIAALPTGPLLEALDALVGTIVSAQPEGAARHVGFLGRLLGHDLVIGAHPDPLEERLKVQLLGAAEQARSLEAAINALRATQNHLARQLSELEQTLSHTRPAEDRDPVADAASPVLVDLVEQRHDRLQSTADSWRAAQAHLAMALQFGLSMLDRHAQARDELVPLWRQHAAAAALGTQLTRADTCRLQSLHDKLIRQIRELGALQSTGRSTPPPPSSESSP